MSRRPPGSRHELISVRTTESLAVRRATGIRLGRPRSCPDDVLSDVVASRACGMKLIDIAAGLNKSGTPTPGGGTRWYPSHVSRLLRTQDAARLLADLAATAA
jgi:hypothetical protein